MDIEAIIKEIQALGTFCVFVGRLNPMHLGHQFQVEILHRAFPGRHLLMLGSCNKEVSIRHLFNYADRADFVHVVHPEVRIVPLPDFGNNELWFKAIDDLIRAAGGDPAHTVFIGGCDEDVIFYGGTGRKVYIVNRFSGVTKNVSGTEVRDALITGKPLDDFLDPHVCALVQERFPLRWREASQR